MFKLNKVFYKISPEYCATYPLRDIFHPMSLVIVNNKFHSASTELSNENDKSAAEIKVENKKKSLFITLIGVDGKLSTSTLDAASKLSKRRDLKLIKVSDSDTKRQNPVYKLLSNTQVLKEDIASKKLSKGRNSGFKSEKIISFSYKISDHDIDSKMKQIIKWLQKKHEVRTTIAGAPGCSGETVYEKIAQALNMTGRILQKRNSGHDIKFTIIPLKEDMANKNISGGEISKASEQMDLGDAPEILRTHKV